MNRFTFPWAPADGTHPIRLQATPGVDAPPLPQPARAFEIPAKHVQTLPNGLEVHTLVRRDLPLVDARLLWRGGSQADPVGQPGLAEMAATLLTKGARRGRGRGRVAGATEIAQTAESLGDALAAAASGLQAQAGMTVMSARLPEALALIADVVRRPVFDAAELERSRTQALDALRVSLQEPQAVAARVLRRLHWGPSVLGASPTEASLKALDVRRLRAFHAAHARPDSAALFLAGDLTPAQARALAERHFGDWRRPAGAPPAVRPAAPEPLAPEVVLVDLPGAGQSAVAVAAPWPAWGPDAAVAERRTAQVLAAVLGGGYSARLNQEVRIKRGLSYGASASGESWPAGGMLVAATQTHHPQAAEVLELLRGEVLKLAAAPAEAAELAARQATLIGALARQIDTLSGLAGLAAGAWSLERPYAELATYVRSIEAVQAGDVQALAQRLWQTGGAVPPLRAVVVGDLKAAGEPLLRAAGTGALRLEMRTLDLDAPRLGLKP